MTQKLARVKDLKEGKSLIVKTKEGKEIALFCLDGTIYALDNTCPHMEGPLGEGDIEGGCVSCPWHGWKFDIKTGACLNVEGEEAKKIPIHVVNGDIYLS